MALRKPSELCHRCKSLYDGYSDMTPETARALKRTGVSSVQDLIRRQQLAIRETCTTNNHEVLDSNDSLDLGWVVGKRYRIWTGDVDIVLGYHNGWVIVQDEKTGQVRSHLTRLDHTDREV